ncbi:hypothetical protein E5676_scaffold5066G00110 [Cucumis melo var. makuwa]|uniref:Uncharacterized protein n=1 Tax=Cucumis melo var. makuwa TaxID=1194695 RepID=A0A5D3D4R1_CUCMM|nr:hypothetical protein E5676_scaffold5066G00110 [Cucumis melo var. makuwa]
MHSASGRASGIKGIPDVFMGKELERNDPSSPRRSLLLFVPSPLPSLAAVHRRPLPYATLDQHVLGAPSGHRRPDFRSYGSACCTCSGTCQRLGEGKGRGKLASDREGFVACHMGTQFCFRVYVSVF